MSQPLVSVVLSVYNGDRFLREAVESVLCQSFRDFEFIIIDDGSIDRSASLFESLARTDDRMRVYHQENRGLVESLNRGCALARGKYIGRMDADDIAMPDRLQRQHDFLDAHPEIAVLGGAALLIGASGTCFGVQQWPKTDREIKSALKRGDCPLLHPTVMMRRDIFVSVNGYRTVVQDAEDYDLWARISDRHLLANLDHIVLQYRRHSHQVSIRKMKQQAYSALAALTASVARRNGRADPLTDIARITPATLASIGISDSQLQSALCRAYVTAVRSMYDAREFSEAARVLQAARSENVSEADRAAITDLDLLSAALLWRQGQIVQSLAMMGSAIIRRPITLGRPVKAVLRRVKARRAYRDDSH